VVGGVPPGSVVDDDGTVVVEPLGPEESGTVVDVVDVVVLLALPPLSTAIGVVEPGCGCQPGGGWVWEGTGPAVGTTALGDGLAELGA
jgi:hypothetical protein